MSTGRAVVAWSGGKDAALALQRIRERDGVAVDRLVTTVSARHHRVSIHGVPVPLVRAQADRLGLPLETVPLPPGCSERQYRQVMGAALDRLAVDGIDTIVFADIYLEDVRRDRERLLATTGLDGRWPLWDGDTTDIAAEIVDRFDAVTAAVDLDQLPRTFAGRPYDRSFLSDLPRAVDPCGEDGAFHTFVRNMPAFDASVDAAVDGIVDRASDEGRMAFGDLRRQS